MIKPGVDLRGLQPQMAVAYTICSTIYARYGTRCVITSGSDGTHGPNSLHYVGKALDLRTHTLPGIQVPLVFKEIQEALGEQFDCINEPTHVHIEFDPKESKKEEA